MNTPHLETIAEGPEVIALIIRAGFDEPGVNFFTPPFFSQQLAIMRHPAGKRIQAHTHKLVPRQVLHTQEVLLIRKGKVRVALYNSQREYLGAPVLTEGDIILLCAGGHAFEMLEETTMVEVKQGPYVERHDKVLFAEQGLQ